MVKKSRKYNIDADKLHSYFVINNELDVNFNSLFTQIFLLKILSNHFYDESSDIILDCAFSIIENLYSISLHQNELLEKSNDIYSDMIN